VLSGRGPAQPHPYAALVEFFDAQYEGRGVRVARLVQPLANPYAQGSAIIEVAETLELRVSFAREALYKSLFQHTLMLSLIALVVSAVVVRATRGARPRRPLAA
jgi:two-component system, OmpR family, sensor histidine kinase TctE